MEPTAHPAAAPDVDPVLVANAVEAAIVLAAKGGLDVTTASEITCAFDPSGDITVTIPGASPVKVAAADIAATADTDEDRESLPPPPMAA